MRLKDLKLEALERAKEMDLSISAKKQVARYIKEADEHETKLFLMDGEVRPVTEDEKEVIDARFNKNEHLQENNQE